MHREILTKEQLELLPFVSQFKSSFGLVGGTAIALQIGHRESTDFDLFSFKAFRNAAVRNKAQKNNLLISKVFKDEAGQFTFFIKGVQFTFYHYPFPVPFTENLDKKLYMPDLLTLAAMKAYALGRRNKWKDYVDMYFILKDFHSMSEIIKKAREIFKGEFNERVFRQTLSYFTDMNYSEEVTFMPGLKVSDQKIKKALIEFSVS